VQQKKQTINRSPPRILKPIMIKCLFMKIIKLNIHLLISKTLKYQKVRNQFILNKIVCKI
jgi:hypothetical protein